MSVACSSTEIESVTPTRLPNYLRKMSEFGASQEDMKDIYIKFIRSVLEFSCVVWGSSLTKENIQTIERVQKVSVNLILKNRFKTYRQNFEVLKLTTLHERRQLLALSFAKSCVKSEIGKNMFQENKNSDKLLRQKEKYSVPRCFTNIMKNSAIPFMTSLLNEDWNNKTKFTETK